MIDEIIAKDYKETLEFCSIEPDNFILFYSMFKIFRRESFSNFQFIQTNTIKQTYNSQILIIFFSAFKTETITFIFFSREKKRLSIIKTISMIT